MIKVPWLTPRLSSGWLALVTPLYYRVGRHLLEGVRNETVVTSDAAARDFPHIRPMGDRGGHLTLSGERRSRVC